MIGKWSSSTAIREMVPSLAETPTGWLAISPRTGPINIAVIGSTQVEARDRFVEAARAWAALHDAPDPVFGRE